MPHPAENVCDAFATMCPGHENSLALCRTLQRFYPDVGITMEVAPRSREVSMQAEVFAEDRAWYFFPYTTGICGPEGTTEWVTHRCTLR